MATFVDTTGNYTVSGGGKTLTRSAAGLGSDHVRLINYPTTGKVYFEIEITTLTSTNLRVGFVESATDYALKPGDSSVQAPGLAGNSYVYTNGSGSNEGLTTMSSGAILQLFHDIDNGKVWFGINGYIRSGGVDVDPATGNDPVFENATVDIVCGVCLYKENAVANLKTGSSDFTHTMPSGFVSLDDALGLVGVTAIGVGELPLFEGEGLAELEGEFGNAEAEIPIFQGEGVAVAATGAVAEGYIPIFEGEGVAVHKVNAIAEGYIPIFQGEGTAGVPKTVEAAGYLPIFEGVGYGSWIGEAYLPMFEGEGEAEVTSLGVGEGYLPIFEGESEATTTLTAIGVGYLPLPTCEAVAHSVATAVGVGYLPIFEGEGKEDVVATGSGYLPLFEAFGVADCERAEYGILSYQRGAVR